MVSKKLSRWLAVFFVLVAIYALAGYFWLPHWLKSTLPELVSEHTNASLTLGDVRVDPFLLAIELKDVSLNGKAPLLKARSIKTDFSIASLWLRMVVIERLNVDGADATLSVMDDGSTNLNGLLKPSDNEEPSSMGIWLKEFTITQSALTLERVSEITAQTHRFENISFQILDLTRQPNNSSNLSLTTAMTDGTQFALNGALNTTPFSLTTQITVNHLPLSSVTNLISDQILVTSGELDVDARINIKLEGGTTHWQLNNGAFHVNKLAVETPTSHSTLNVQSMAIQGVTAGSNHDVQIGAVSVSEGDIALYRNKNGRLLLPELGTSHDKDEPSLWRISLNTLVLNTFNAHLQDDAANLQHQWNIESLQWGPWSNAPDAPPSPLLAKGMYQSETPWNIKGEISPQRVDMDLQFSQLMLTKLNPYTHPFVNGQLLDGTLDTTLRVEYRDGEIHAQGDSVANTIALAVGEDTVPSVSANAIRVDQWQIDTHTRAAQIERITLNNAQLLAQKNDKGELNLAQLAKTPATDLDDASQDKAPTPWSLQLNTLSLGDSNIQFEDLAVTPNVRLSLDKLDSRITGLTSNPNASAKLELSALINQSAPLKAQGKFNPFQPRTTTNVDLQLRGFDLPAISPYALQFTSRPIDRGKANLDVNYQVTETSLLVLNHIVLNRMRLGDLQPAEGRDTLPLKLALSLLKDANDQVEIHVPVEGDLDNPETRYGHLVFRALGNLIVGVVKSPFSLLGKLVGLDGNQLSVVAFADGQHDLSVNQTRNLDKLALALSQRPNIALEFRPTYDPKRDRAGLVHRILQNRYESIHSGAPLERWPSNTPDDPKIQQALVELLVTIQGEKALTEVKQQLTKQGVEANLRNTAGAAIKRLEQAQNISEEDLRALAQRRQDSVRNYLVAQGLATDRLFLLEPQAIDASDTEFVESGMTIKGR